METTRIIGGIAFVAAFFAASLLALWIAGCARRSRHGSEAALLSGADSSRMQHLLRNGISSLKPLSNELLKARVVERFIERLQNALAERDMETYPQSLASLLLGGALAVLILGAALSASFVCPYRAHLCAALPQFVDHQAARQLSRALARRASERHTSDERMLLHRLFSSADLRASCPRPRRPPEAGLPEKCRGSGRRRNR